MSYFNDDGYNLRPKGSAAAKPAGSKPAGSKPAGSKTTGSKTPGSKSRRGRRKAGRGHRKGKPTFSTYIFNTQKDIKGQFGFSKKAMAVMNSVVTDVFDRLMIEASNLAKYAKKKTVGANEIEHATKMIFSGDLSKHSVEAGKEAVKKFEREVSKDGAKKGGKHVSKSSKAGLIFPVGRIARHMKNARVASRIGAGAPVFVAAVLQQITGELLEAANKQTLDTLHKKRITPRSVNLGIIGDEELEHVFSKVTIAAGGVKPDNIHKSLLGKAAQKKAAAAADDGGYYYY